MSQYKRAKNLINKYKPDTLLIYYIIKKKINPYALNHFVIK